MLQFVTWLEVILTGSDLRFLADTMTPAKGRQRRLCDWLITPGSEPGRLRLSRDGPAPATPRTSIAGLCARSISICSGRGRSRVWRLPESAVPESWLVDFGLTCSCSFAMRSARWGLRDVPGKSA